MGFRPCAVIPSRNHYRDIEDVVSAVRAAGMPAFIIDDGSDEPARSVLAKLHDPADGITVARLDPGQGKGAAVCHGFRMAATADYTHAIQIDADGQHDIRALPRLLELSQQNPQALVSGQAVYDRLVPRARRIGRWVTHVWVWIETLSFRIRDSMCGFRAYPLAVVISLLDDEPVGQGMDFDTAILVRLFWRGVPVVALPVKVVYPAGNLSNFDLVRDNWRITCMHTRLVLTMLVRLPSILSNRPPPLDRSRHWANLSERGLYWGLRFCAATYRLLGRHGCMIVIAPIVLYFFLTGTEQRRASRTFLTRAFAAQGHTRKAGWMDGYRHLLSFAGRAVDTFAGWTGGLSADAVIRDAGSVSDEISSDRRGALLIVAHVGNADLARAVLDEKTRNRFTVLVHTRHAANYNRVLKELNPASAFNTFQVTEIGPDTAIALSERIERGEWIVIAGDRTPVGNRKHVSRVRFLGKDAPFANGPYVLAALLDCPVYTLFCLREGHGYRLYMEKFEDRVELPRRDRATELHRLVERFAAKLEYYVLKDPYQWYNFYDFWAEPGGEDVDAGDRDRH